jgi:hypothetical protein
MDNTTTTSTKIKKIEEGTKKRRMSRLYGTGRLCACAVAAPNIDSPIIQLTQQQVQKLPAHQTQR